MFVTEMRGWLPSSQLYEAIDMATCDVEDEYKNMSKEEYIQYVCGLFYMEKRCQEIFVGLRGIAKELYESYLTKTVLK